MDAAIMSNQMPQLIGENLVSPPPNPGVAVILLNWNGWKNTVECLESVFRMSYPPSLIVVCDNASTDESLERICDWANGNLTATCTNPDLISLLAPPVPKPLRLAMINASDEFPHVASEIPLVLIQTGANLGFAGGNNVGLRYALSRSDISYFWLLNNDTVVEPGALGELIAVMRTDSRLGFCGSVLRDYFRPKEVLTLGGRRYSRLSGRTRPIQIASPPEEQDCPDYIEGASMLVRRNFLEEVGLMAEDYFLYFEEIDWTIRARGRFTFTYASRSIVYHKEGGSTGSHRDRNERSALSDFYQARNRLTFTWRYFPWLTPPMLLSVVGTAIHRLLRGRKENATAVVRGIFAALNPNATSIK